MEMTEPEFRKLLKELVEGLGLKEAGYKPYSLRRGGATGDFRRHGSLDRATVRGRWRSSASARIYITEGVEMYARLQRRVELEDELQRRVARFWNRVKRRWQE